MAIINIKLMAARTKPTIEIETDLTSRSVLVDTGAHDGFNVPASVGTFFRKNENLNK